MLVSVIGAAQPGTLDPTFNPLGTGANNGVLASAIQSDGKIIIGGQFTNYNGTAKNRIARLNSDGTFDASLVTVCNALVTTIVIQPDGKVIIGGNFTNVNGTLGTNRITRLNADGTIDASFNSGVGANQSVTSINLLPGGQILICGDFTEYNGVVRNSIARLNADGTIDNSFDPGVGANGVILNSKLQSDGKIVVSGNFTTFDGTSRKRVARLNADGSLDVSFDPGTGANNDIHGLAIQSDGKILIGGNFGNFNGVTKKRIARLNADGSLDNTFTIGTGADKRVYEIIILSDGKIVMAGNFDVYNGATRNKMAVLNTDGTLDTSFNIGTGFVGLVRSLIKQQAYDELIVGGEFTSYNGTAINRIARINSRANVIVNMDTPTGYVLPTIATHVRAFEYEATGVKTYRFRITNNTTGAVAEVLRPTKYVTIPSTISNYNTSYTITASAVIDGQPIPYLGNTIIVSTPGVDKVKLHSSVCGVTLNSLGQTIRSTWGQNATSYTFRARIANVGPASPASIEYFYTAAQSNVYTSMNAFAGLVPQYGASYAISVSFDYVDIATGDTVSSGYGDECLVKMPSIPTIGLISPMCGSTLSTKGQTIIAAHTTGASAYQLQVRETGGSIYYENAASASPYSNLMSFPGLTIADGTSYSISARVQVMIDGVPTWSAYGAECVLITPSAMLLRTIDVPFTAVAYPNPFTNSFLLDVKSSNTSNVDITVYDMLGRLVEQRQVSANELETTTIGSNYPAGIYNVVIAQDTDTKTVRVIKR